MANKTKAQLETEATLRAARNFSRRVMLQAFRRRRRRAGGRSVDREGCLLVLGRAQHPQLVGRVAGSRASRTSRRQTGIKVNPTPFSQNEEQINKLQATGGEGFDLCQPTRDRAPQFKDLGVLAPFDTNKLANSKNLIPSMLEGSTSVWTWDGGLYHVPHCWGSEAISWRTDLTKLEYETLSYGTLWNDEYKGKVQGRPHSLLLGIGLWMDAHRQAAVEPHGSTPSRTKRPSRRSTTRSSPSRSSTSRGSSSSGTAPTTPSRACWRTAW